MTIRQDITEALKQYDYRLYVNDDSQSDRFSYMLDHATDEQLWTFYKWSEQGRKWQIKYTLLDDHIAVEVAGTAYVAILPDGSAHS